MASLFGNFFRARLPSAPDVREVDRLYAEATGAYQAKEFTRAIPLYERVIALRPDHAEAHYKRANCLKDLGQLEAALAGYDAAIERKPEFQYAWCNRGAVQQALGLTEAALASFERACVLDPDDVLAHSNRASLLVGMSRWEEALAAYDRVLALNPQLASAWFQRGNVLRLLGRPEAALASYQKAVSLDPGSAEAHYNRGVLLEETRQLHAALVSYDQAIAANPELHQAHFNRGVVFQSLKEPQSALDAYDRAIAIKVDHAPAYANRGVVLRELERWDEALSSYDQALALRPDYPECALNRSALLKARKQWDAALAGCDQVISARPDFAEAYFERASILAEVGRLQESLEDYDRAIALRPDFAEAHYNRALALLLSGDYENGWPSYEWRWRNADRLLMGNRAFGQPLWLGRESIAGKRLLIHSEQGLGDAIQFCRFAKPVAELGATVILEVQPALLALLQSLDGVSQVIAEGSPLPEHDYHCPMMSLPLALKTTLDRIPAAVGYLHADPAKVLEWRGRLGKRSRPRIGLVWSGNPRQFNDRERSFRLARLTDYLPREFDYFCLQKEVRPADQETLAANPWICRYDSEMLDFPNTAALCECLDLVISVCTSIAHLSGALGRPTWVLLPFNADWRWLLHRTDSPWYESITLYRQAAAGDWDAVFARVGADLRSRFL